MSKPTFINSSVVYNDHSTEYNIDARGNNDIHSLIHSCEINNHQAETIQDVTPAQEYFPHITQKCIAEKRVEAVDAEIRAACKGTAEGLWRTLWNNENLGYIVVEPINATTLYKDIESFYGKLPFKERQFRSARNKR